MAGILKFLCFLSVLLCTQVFSADETVGDFDIRKVHQAIAENRKTQPGSTAGNRAAVGQSESEPESVVAIISRIAAYLALIVLVVLAISWFVKRTGAVGGTKGGGGAMDVLEVLPIGQGRTLVLVRVMDHVLILSQTPQRVTLLDKIEGQKALEMIAAGKDGTSIVQFKDVFNNFVNKMKKSS